MIYILKWILFSIVLININLHYVTIKNPSWPPTNVYNLRGQSTMQEDYVRNSVRSGFPTCFSIFTLEI